MTAKPSPELTVSTDRRRALEALRNGVPNRDAVRVLGCEQPEVEERFRRSSPMFAGRSSGVSQ